MKMTLEGQLREVISAIPHELLWTSVYVVPEHLEKLYDNTGAHMEF